MRVIGVRIVEESGDAHCSFTLRLVQIHVILIAFTLPKWMQVNEHHSCKSNFPTFHSIFQVPYTLSLINSLKIKTFPFSSNGYLHLFLLISTPFAAKPPMHFTIWVHSCMYMSEQSLSFLPKTLPKHCKALPNHSYCLEITPSLAISLSPFLRLHTPSTTGDRLCR